jgi:uncharacterized protein YdaU (DUF1376 family)
MSKNRWFKFFPSDFLTGIRNLNAVEVTAYIIVLCELYDHEGSIRRDDDALAASCRIRKTDLTRAIDSLVSKGKLDMSSGMLTNKRASEVILNRLVSAEERARLRRELDVNLTRTRREEREKTNKNNASSNDVGAYIRNKNKKEPFFDVDQPRGVEGYLDRKRQRGERFQ